MLKKFLVQIWAYDHYAKFEALAEDNAESIEKSILDKIGEKSIKWESTGMYKDIPNRITYEEVVDGTRAVQTKTVLGVEVAVGV
jgi:outer membrane cobalamin receptor